MINYFCGMIDQQKALSLISSRDHCERSSPSRISNMLLAEFEPEQNLSSDLAEWSCAAVITTAPLGCGFESQSRQLSIWNPKTYTYNMQFWHVTSHGNSSKRYLFRRCLLRCFFMLLTHQLFATFMKSQKYFSGKVAQYI